MGNWVIVIHGTGPHHNGSATDADQIAARLTDELSKSGQMVTSATIVSGTEQNLNQVVTRVPLKTSEPTA